MSLAVFLKYNLKILFRKNFLAGLVYGLIVPFIFNLAHPVMISEVYLSPVGIIFLTQLSEIDGEDGMNELVSVRQKGVHYNLLSRYLMGTIFIAGVISWFLGYLSIQGIGFNFGKLFMGTFITALFLGTLGLTIANILKNYVAGYIVSFTYYLFDFMTGGEYTGDLFLFSLSRGEFFPKYYLLGISILLIGINLVYLKYRTVE